MLDWDDDLPAVKTNLKQQLVEGRSMVRSVLKVSLTVGAAVGAATTLTALVIEKARHV